MDRNIEEIIAEYNETEQEIKQVEAKISDINDKNRDKINNSPELAELSKHESEVKDRLSELEDACGHWVNVRNNNDDLEEPEFVVTDREAYAKNKDEILKLRDEKLNIVDKHFQIRNSLEKDTADLQIELGKKLDELNDKLKNLKKELVVARTNKGKEDPDLIEILNKFDEITDWEYNAVFKKDEITVNEDGSVNLVFTWSKSCEDYDDQDYFSDDGYERNMEDVVEEEADDVLADICDNVEYLLEGSESPYHLVRGKEDFEITKCDIRVSKYDSWEASWDEPAGYEMETDGDATVKLTVVISK